MRRFTSYIRISLRYMEINSYPFYFSPIRSHWQNMKRDFFQAFNRGSIFFRFKIYKISSKILVQTIVGCITWMSWYKFNLIIYDLSGIMQFREFVEVQRSLACVVFNQFLLLNATDRSKISCDQYRIKFDVNLYPLQFFANNPFKMDFPNKASTLP